MDHKISTSEARKSGRLFAYASGTFVLGLIGHGLRRAAPDSWRGNGEIWDFWSHIGNVPDSVLVVSGVTMITSMIRKDLFRTDTRATVSVPEATAHPVITLDQPYLLAF